jgi:hypothetical protein
MEFTDMMAYSALNAYRSSPKLGFPTQMNKVITLVAKAARSTKLHVPIYTMASGNSWYHWGTALRHCFMLLLFKSLLLIHLSVNEALFRVQLAALLYGVETGKQSQPLLHMQGYTWLNDVCGLVLLLVARY